MTTRIKLHTCFALAEFDTEFIDLPASVKTVADLLAYMGKRMKADFIDAESGKTEFDLEIQLNRKEIWFHPEGLKTKLKPEDFVEIYPLPLGGG